MRISAGNYVKNYLKINHITIMQLNRMICDKHPERNFESTRVKLIMFLNDAESGYGMAKLCEEALNFPDGVIQNIVKIQKGEKRKGKK